MSSLLVFNSLHTMQLRVVCQFKHLPSLYDSHRMHDVYLIDFMHVLFNRVLPDLWILLNMSNWLYQLHIFSFLLRLFFRLCDGWFWPLRLSIRSVSEFRIVFIVLFSLE